MLNKLSNFAENVHNLQLVPVRNYSLILVNDFKLDHFMTADQNTGHIDMRHNLI